MPEIRLRPHLTSRGEIRYSLLVPGCSPREATLDDVYGLIRDLLDGATNAHAALLEAALARGARTLTEAEPIASRKAPR